MVKEAWLRLAYSLIKVLLYIKFTLLRRTAIENANIFKNNDEAKNNIIHKQLWMNKKNGKEAFLVTLINNSLHKSSAVAYCIFLW